MPEQDMDELFRLFRLGGAHSEGFRAGRQGSARIFAYGLFPANESTLVTCVDITTWDRAKLTVQPATKESVQAALDELGVTEKNWTL